MAKTDIVTYSTKKVGAYNYVYLSCYCDDGRAEKSIGASPSKQVVSDIETAIEKHYSLCKMGRGAFLKADVIKIVTSVVSPGKKNTGLTLLEGLRKYSKELSNGLDRDGKPASKGTILSLNCAIGFIETRTSLGSVPIEAFDMSHIKMLHKALYTCKSNRGDGKLSQNTVFAYCTQIILFFKFTYKLYHNNPIHKEDDVFLPAEAIDHAVYCNIDEIQALYKMPMSGTLELCRDMFVYGCFTCMRISDHNAHSGINITPDYIIMSAIKTGSKSAIPLHPIVKEILAKYGGHPPKMDGGTFNRVIKQVLRDAKDDKGSYMFHDKVMFKRTEGGKKAERITMRYLLATTHTMRRSFVTNALLAGLPEDQIMRIGGWKSYEAFRRYKRATDIDVAKAAAQHPFFTGKAS